MCLLQELELDTRFCCDVRIVCKQLKHLTALSHLFLNASHSNCDASAALGSALPSCPSLASLSLENSGHGAANIAVALPHLPHLTSLKLSKFWISVWSIHYLFRQLTQLEALDMRGMQGWGIHSRAPMPGPSVYNSIGLLTRLQWFDAWSPCAEHPDSTHTQKLLSALPATLTGLDLQGSSIDTSRGHPTSTRSPTSVIFAWQIVILSADCRNLTGSLSGLHQLCAA